MSFQDICAYLDNASLMYGFSLKDIGNIKMWNKNPEVEQLIEKLRCLHDILDYIVQHNPSYTSIYTNILYTIESIIDTLEKNESCTSVVMTTMLIEYSDIDVNCSLDDNERSKILNCVNLIINEICKSLSNHSFDEVYKENKYVHDYMNKFYSGVTYVL